MRKLPSKAFAWQHSLPSPMASSNLIFYFNCEEQEPLPLLDYQNYAKG